MDDARPCQVVRSRIAVLANLTRSTNTALIAPIRLGGYGYPGGFVAILAAFVSKSHFTGVSMQDSGIAESGLHKFLDDASYVVFHGLSVRPEDGEFVVGRVDIGNFVAMPEVGARAIEYLSQGCTVAEARALLADDYGEEIDLDDFVSNLVELGFVQSIDGREIQTGDAKPPNLPWLRPNYVRWIFSWPMRLLYVGLLAAAAFAVLLRPELIPHYQDFFWTGTTSLLILTGTLLSTMLVAGHELAHLIAARSLGVPARIGFGTRLTRLVVETDVTGVWALPRRERYRVYLAGIAWDLLAAAVAILVLAYGSPGNVVASLLRVLVMLAFLGIVGQFAFYMRTDVYFVVMDLLRCRNLFEDARANLRYVMRRIQQVLAGQVLETRLSSPLAQLPAHERPKVQLYTWFMAVGSAISLTFFALYSLPIMVGLCVNAVESIQTGMASKQVTMMADGVATLVVEIGFQILFIRTLVRNKGNWLACLRTRLCAMVGFARVANLDLSNGSEVSVANSTLAKASIMTYFFRDDS